MLTVVSGHASHEENIFSTVSLASFCMSSDHVETHYLCDDNALFLLRALSVSHTYIDFISHQVQQIRQRQTDKTHRAQSTITHTIIIKTS